MQFKPFSTNDSIRKQQKQKQPLTALVFSVFFFFFFVLGSLENGRKDKFHAAGHGAGSKKKNCVVIQEVCFIHLITAKIKLITEFLS